MLLLWISYVQCQSDAKAVNHYSLIPDYSSVSLTPTQDTIKFRYDSTFYNSIRSFNYFSDSTRHFLALYDKSSLCINVYDIESEKLYKKICVKSFLPYKNLQSKTTVFVHDLQNIYIINLLSLYKINSSGTIMDSIQLQSEPVLSLPSFSNTTPPVFMGKNNLYITADPILKRTRMSDIKRWNILYQIDFEKRRATTFYPLPKTYSDNRYDEKFFMNGYCLNNKNRFVFSFAADTNIYETDLKGYHTSFFAKSYYHTQAIQSLPQKTPGDEAVGKKQFLLSDSYGPIYFDPFAKRYIRVVKYRLTEEELRAKQRTKRQALLILDESLKIIGECPIGEAIDVNAFIITPGGIYAHLIHPDEYAFYLIRLNYQENKKKTL